MTFKMITLSEKEVGRIAGNALAHSEMMANDLTERWRDQLPEDQKVVDIYQVQLCVRHDLHQMRAKIAEIEKRHLGLLETETLSRETRKVTIPQLRGKLVGIRDLFEGSFGVGSSAKVFGPRVTTIPLDPFPLRRLAHIAHDRLMDPTLVLPPAQLAGVEIQPQALAKDFEAPLAELDTVLVELEDTLPISNASLEEKIRTLAELRSQAGIAARFLEALYHLAGHPEIARRVRPSSHRSRRIATTTSGDGDSGDGRSGDGDSGGNRSSGGDSDGSGSGGSTSGGSGSGGSGSGGSGSGGSSSGGSNSDGGNSGDNPDGQGGSSGSPPPLSQAPGGTASSNSSPNTDHSGSQVAHQPVT